MIIRHNDLEQKMINTICANVQLDSHYPNVRTVEIVKIIKKNDKGNKILTDVPSPYLTYTGRNMVTEAVLCCPNYDIDWRVECKGQKKITSLVARVYEELRHVAKISEDKYCLILGGALLSTHVIKRIAEIIAENNLQDKVWYGSICDFEEKLQKQMEKYITSQQ